MVETHLLTASDAQAFDTLGQPVSLSGDTIVAGAHQVDCAGSGDHCGSAYVFRFNGSDWIEEQKLFASDAAEEDRFGSSVAVCGNTAVVGAPRNDCEPTNCCVAHDTPGCEDPAAEAFVCGIEPDCCTDFWDTGCANIAGICLLFSPSGSCCSS